MKLTKEEQDKFLKLIKTIDLNIPVIRGDNNKKWYKFGAYDALKILAEKVVEDER